MVGRAVVEADAIHSGSMMLLQCNSVARQGDGTGLSCI
jgi:hypothetical protein